MLPQSNMRKAVIPNSSASSVIVGLTSLL